MDMPMRNTPYRLLPLVPLVLIGWLYGPVLGFDYVWDDRALFVNSAGLRQLDGLWQAVAQPILPGTTYFRPAVLLSFAAEFLTFGVSPALSHSINLLLHIANTALVGLLAFLMFSAQASQQVRLIRASVAMLLYGLHPALIEPTTWVAGRFDLMVTFFVLAGILAAHTLNGALRIVVVCLLFFLAALSKEMAATFPALLLLWLWANRYSHDRLDTFIAQTWRRGEWRLIAAIVMTGLAYLALRYWNFAVLTHEDAEVAAKLDFWRHLAFVGHTIVFYARMVLWPFSDLNPQHPLDPADLTPLDIGFGTAVLGFAMLAALLVLRSHRPSALLILGGLISLLPVLHLIPLTTGGNIGHERFLTLPLVFFVLALVRLPLQVAGLSDAMRITLPRLISLALVGWCFVSIMNLKVTIPLWRNELSLWSWAYQRHSDFPFVQFSLAGAAIRYGQFELAERVFNEAEERGNMSPRLKALYGQFLARTHHPREAIDQIEAALAEDFKPHEEVLARGIELSQANIERRTYGRGWYMLFAYTALAEAGIAIKDFDYALRMSEISLFYQRDYPPANFSRALALYGLDRLDEAEAAFNHALTLYLADGRHDASVIRQNFLKQLCEQPNVPHTVCATYHKMGSLTVSRS